MAREISEERKVLYYLGMVVFVIGIILIVTVIVTACNQMGKPPKQGFSEISFDSHGNLQAVSEEDGSRSIVFRIIGGMVLTLVGGVIMRIGRAGLAGSGIALNPKQAREDLEPFSRQAGGMLKDALDEAQIDLGRKPEKVIMVKCPTCTILNDEDAKFCKSCGHRF